VNIERAARNIIFTNEERTPVLSDKSVLLLFYESGYNKMAAVGGGVWGAPAPRQQDSCPQVRLILLT
jgi:hypothetical protein